MSAAGALSLSLAEGVTAYGRVDLLGKARRYRRARRRTACVHAFATRRVLQAEAEPIRNGDEECEIRVVVAASPVRNHEREDADHRTIRVDRRGHVRAGL